MTHPIYSAKYLLKKGISYCKQIAKELGISPEGDKRQLFTWVEAIVEHQSSVQPVQTQKQEARIEYNDGINSCELQKYMVIVGGVVVARFTTYLQAEKFAEKEYILVDPQSVAQAEFEAELVETTRVERSKSIEVVEQHTEDGFAKFVTFNHENGNYYTVTPAHPNPKERCECGDTHLRGVTCKHQIAVRNDIASQIQFISPSGFGDWEAVVDGQVIATIEQDFDAGLWMVGAVPFTSYAEAENYIKDQYVKDVLMSGRGSVRITPAIEDIAMSIEDIEFRDSKGQQYAVRVNGVLAGYIWLDDDNGWTLNGEDCQDDWRAVARELVSLTRHDYLVAA